MVTADAWDWTVLVLTLTGIIVGFLAGKYGHRWLYLLRLGLAYMETEAAKRRARAKAKEKQQL